MHTLLVLYCHLAGAQNSIDTLFTNNGRLAVSIKEITNDAIKFSYPGEELVNSIYKNSVFKIVHRSGRLETFNETSSFNIVKGGDEWEKVAITSVPDEVKGLYKLGNISTKATGATAFANVNSKRQDLQKIKD